MYNITKTATSGDIDLSTLTIEELDRLSFDEEVAAAEKIKASAPFSKERNSLIKEGYALINQIAEEKAQRRGMKISSYGANDACSRLVKRLVHKHKKQTNKDTLVFYEAGVGTGLVINALLEEKHIHIKGCDAILNENLKNNSRLDLHEGTIFDSLQETGDESIDIFYWNDVLEHILDDEINEYLKLIYHKMAYGGIIITITPNRLYGPCDVTRLFYPAGTKAKGFHFHEYTYAEVTKLFKVYGFTSFGNVVVNPITRNYLTTPDVFCAIKWFMEKISPYIYPFLLRKILLQVSGCHVSVFKKS
jgi:hypothetical protein